MSTRSASPRAAESAHHSELARDPPEQQERV
ncbi:hypothetical protein ACVWY9_001947 [Thermostichus sp. OS-CIW-31]